MTDTDYSEVEPWVSYRPKRADQWVAVLGSAIPMALVLGVVVFEFFISLAGLVWLINRMVFSTRPKLQITRQPLFWPLSVWFLTIIASRLINGGSAYHFANDIVYVIYPLFVVAMVDVASRFPVHRYLMIGLMVGVAYAGVNLLSAHLIGYDFLGKPLSRYVHRLNEGQRIGAMGAYAAPILMIRAMVDRPMGKGMRCWIVAMAITALGLLIGSMARTAMIASLIGLLGTFLSLLIIRKRINLGILLSLLLLSGLGLWAVMWFQPGLESLYDRIYIWEVSFQVWLQHPVFGVGISSFKHASRQVVESGIVAPFVSPAGNIYQDATPHHAHNIFLQLMACNGILGLGAFLWTYTKASWNAWRLGAGRHAGLLCWPFVCMTIGLTGWNIYDPFYATLVFFFMAMIGVSMNNGNGDALLDHAKR